MSELSKSEQSSLNRYSTLFIFVTIFGIIFACTSEEELQVNVGTNYCPHIDYLEISPIKQEVGSAITLTLETSDLDHDSLTTTWTADPPLNSFEEASSNTKLYHCHYSGEYALAVVTSDGKCEATIHADVACISTWAQAEASDYDTNLDASVDASAGVSTN